MVEPLRILEIFERIMRDAEGKAEYHYVLADYICRIAGGSARPGDDVSRVEWVTLEGLGAYRITEGTVAVIEKGFRERGQ